MLTNKKLTIIVIILSFLYMFFFWFYTNSLIKAIKEEELNRVKIWSDAYKNILETDINEKINPVVFNIITSNKTIPVVLTDTNLQVISYSNFKENKLKNLVFLKKLINKGNILYIKLSDKKENFIIYDESIFLKKLKFFPYISSFFIFIFLVIILISLNYFTKAEVNHIWVRLSKETAHQIGTPLSSISGWIELLKNKYSNDSIFEEINKDLDKLFTITERFSKIGLKPRFEIKNINEVISKSINYLNKRIPNQITIIHEYSEYEIYCRINELLFQWVIENLFKNSVDAIEGKGFIKVSVTKKKKNIVIDISDTGKGIQKKHIKKIFRQGFTTKKYGWGTGLVLSKRIIEDYHKGKIYLYKTQVGVGTTIRIELKC